MLVRPLAKATEAHRKKRPKAVRGDAFQDRMKHFGDAKMCPASVAAERGR